MVIEKELLEKLRGPVDVLPEDVELEAQDLNPQDIDVLMMDDGGAEVDFDPTAQALQGAQQHDANLADFLEDQILSKIASDLQNSYQEYKSSRSDWENTYTKGLDLLGFKYETRSEPFAGSSGATHPVLAEAVTQFQSLAYKELLPADGPVRAKIIGMVDDMREKQADRVKDYMNYQMMCE